MHYFLKKALLCVFLASAFQAFAQLDLQPVAIVRFAKTEQISVKQFKEYVNWLSITRAATGESETLSDEEKRQALEELANQFLACQAADQEKVTVTDRELNQYFEQSIKTFSEGLAQIVGHTPTDAEIDTELRSRTGMTRAAYKELMKRTLTTENYLRAKKQGLFEAVKPPADTEIQKIYNETKGKSIFDNGFIRPDAVRVRMLLVPIRNSGERNAAQSTANSLKSQIGNDAGIFDEKFMDRKADSGYLSGDTYLYKHDQMRQIMGADFINAVFNLKQSEVSKLLERPNGFYIVKVIETYRSKPLELDDIYNLEDSRGSTVRQTIAGAEMQRRFMETVQKASEELVTELRKKGSVQIMDDTLKKITW